MPSKVPRRPLHQHLKPIPGRRVKAKDVTRIRIERTNSTAVNANVTSQIRPHITAAEVEEEEEEEEVEKMETVSDIRKAIWVETPICE